MTKTKFSEWFIGQHGARPSRKPIAELRKDRDEKLSDADAAVRLVAACELWEAKRTSAFYAWQARTISENKSANWLWVGFDALDTGKI